MVTSAGIHGDLGVFTFPHQILMLCTLNHSMNTVGRRLGESGAIRFAREMDVPISIRDGGHSATGLAIADDALMIDRPA